MSHSHEVPCEKILPCLPEYGTAECRKGSGRLELKIIYVGSVSVDRIGLICYILEIQQTNKSGTEPPIRSVVLKSIMAYYILLGSETPTAGHGRISIRQATQCLDGEQTQRFKWRFGQRKRNLLEFSRLDDFQPICFSVSHSTIWFVLQHEPNIQ